MGLGVERIHKTHADFALDLVVVGFVELGRGKLALRLSGQGLQLFNTGNNLLDLPVCELDGPTPIL